MPWSRFEKQWSIQEEGRILSYKDALREAIDQAMCLDPKVFAIGLDADDCYGVYGSMLNLSHPERVLGTPISENAMTGVALGAALTGMRPIHIHMRVDFLPVAMDQITNYVSKWKAMFGGKPKVPLVIRAVVGRGWGCGAQHSQTLHGMFAHLPGLSVVTPATPRDAKGLLLQAIALDEPVLFLEHRWLYKNEGAVPEEMYTIPLGKGQYLRRGDSLTIVAPSLAAIHSLQACEEHDLDVDLIDPRTIKPLDRELILDSVRRTGRLLVVDYDSPVCGFASEVLALVAEEAPEALLAGAQKMTFPDVPMPASGVLERRYYPDPDRIAAKAKAMISRVKGEGALV
ncbi:MAG TPA: alpha-ketoacid dehydrogenase subunit beta [Planctomycetes bacterium]|nr:alpha-ketoacid dehydrogenase subunit beta [Planctomycetota bacterium]